MYGGIDKWNMYPYMNTMGWRPTQPMISETDIQRRMYLPQVSADLRDRAIVWQEYKTPDQKLYYYNTKSQERTWNKPTVIQELDDAIAVIKEQKAKKAFEEAKAQEGFSNDGKQGEVNNKVGTDNDEKKLDNSSNKKSPSQNTASSTLDGQIKGGNSAANNNSQQQTGSSSKQREGMRPVSTTPIPNTPWCIVWTDKNRVFYFNPSTKTSVWDRPAELRNREDVDKMVSNPPNIVTQPNNSDDNSRSSSTNDQTSSHNEKRIKLDTKVNPSPGKDLVDKSGSNGSSDVNTKPLANSQTVKKEITTEIEKEALKKRETIPLEERIETFRKMLDEREVDPTSTFQRELRKIVFDARYLLLVSNERREVFEKYCLEKGEEDRRRRREKMKKATDEFKQLLRDANLTSRSIYDDFHDRYSQDPRYRALDRTKDREILFDDHLALLRRKEREERSHSKHRSSSSSHHHAYHNQQPQYQSSSRRTDSHSKSSVRSGIGGDGSSSNSSSSSSPRSAAIENFKQLLRETKLIDKDTRKKIEESEHQHLIDIVCTLQNDDRYTELESMCEERRKILLNYIEELARSN